MSEDIFISAIICTHCRPGSLNLLLESLTKQTWQGKSWELLVIENDTQPSEEVRQVIESFKEQLPVRVLFDNIANLSRARNIGAREARGEYIAYLDDDCVAEPGWLNALICGCKEYNPDFCAGPIYPIYRAKKPYWYKDEWGTYSYCGEEIVPTKIAPSGGNFIVRRNLAIELGGFEERLGMSGRKVAYGEETNLMMRARKSNPDIFIIYLPGAACRHEVFPSKMRINWCVKSAWATGRDCVMMGAWGYSARSPIRMLKQLLLESLKLASKLPCLAGVAVADVFRPGRGVWRRYMMESMVPIITRISISNSGLLARLRGVEIDNL
ncbi:MAG: glycosyltransferase [Armatimonadota bacterium]|nr:glycosyltransferase [bacterium]